MEKLDVQIIRKDGREQFAVLPWEQFKQLTEEFEDALDLVALLEAKIENGDEPGVPLEEVRRRLGLNDPAESAA